MDDEDKENNQNESVEDEEEGEEEPEVGNEGFERGFKVETILGASDCNGRLQFLVKWKNTAKAGMVDANIANAKCPQDVIAFYEKRISWNQDSEPEH